MNPGTEDTNWSTDTTSPGRFAWGAMVPPSALPVRHARRVARPCTQEGHFGAAAVIIDWGNVPCLAAWMRVLKGVCPHRRWHSISCSLAVIRGARKFEDPVCLAIVVLVGLV